MRRIALPLALCLALAGCGSSVDVTNADGSRVHVDCPGLPTAVPATVTSGTCTWVASPAPTTPPATTVAPTTTTPSPPVGRTCPALPAFPTPACTGTPAGITLTSVTGDLTATAGTVIDGKRITGKIVVTGNGVVIRNSDVYGGVTNGAGHYTYTVTDSTIGAPTGCDGGVALMFDKYTATRVLIRHFGDAFRATSNPATNGPAANSAASDVLVQDSYVLLCSNPGDHSDGYQGYYGGTGVQLLHNTIDQRSAPSATAPIFSADWSKGIVARDNLLAGGSYSIRVYDDGTNTANSRSVVTGNRVVNGAWQYGPSASDCASITWTNNTLVDIDANYTVTNTVGALACS